MSAVTPAILAKLPGTATIFDAKTNRRFSVSVRQGQLYQSEWETGDDGKDVFRETERVEWIMGAGANALGGIIRRGDHLFEAPLTFYEKTHTWALSPGYEEADRGFSRPIDAACIVCHSARPNPVAGAAGQFRNPPFDELAIGCETCHGPGSAHLREKRQGTSNTSALSIVNPAKLTPWLADNICMACHQNGDARVLQPGKSFQDFRPGQPLDHTLAILMAPPTRESPPDSDHVQHYFSMTLSQCYRSSAGKLSCITCHDPHIQPAPDEAAAYYKGKCLSCHSETSCALPLATRQAANATDSCIACHMPKREVTQISHASLTNHRIIAMPDEPFPDATFQLTTRSLPDLVHLDAIPGQLDITPPLLTLLQAYGQLGVEHREYVPRYFEVGKQLESSEPNNVNVLEALAARSLQQKTPEQEQVAMRYLDRAIAQGSTAAWDFEQLGSWRFKNHKFPEAALCLEKGIERAPYDPNLYTLLAQDYIAMNNRRAAVTTLERALQRFPQIDLLRGFLGELEQAAAAEQQTNSSKH